MLLWTELGFRCALIIFRYTSWHFVDQVDCKAWVRTNKSCSASSSSTNVNLEHLLNKSSPNILTFFLDKEWAFLDSLKKTIQANAVIRINNVLCTNETTWSSYAFVKGVCSSFSSHLPSQRRRWKSAMPVSHKSWGQNLDSSEQKAFQQG